MAIQNVTDAYITPQTDGEIYNGDSSNQRYSINPNLLTANESVIIVDQGGSNSIELLDGLEINSSIVTADEALITLSNGATINIRGANTFTYEIGQHLGSGDTDGTTKTFEEFSQDVLGVTVPDSGTAEGGASTVNDDGSGTSPGVTVNDNRLVGTDGDDILLGSDGNDILRGGAGVDSMDGGVGDDIFVVVGDLSAGGKEDTDEDTYALGHALTDLNGQNLNEDEDGAVEIIRGGDGDDTLYIYGTADISNYDITGIEHIVIRSDVTFLIDVLQSVQSLTGDGNSTVRIQNLQEDFQSLDLSLVQFSDIGHIELGTNTELLVSAVEDLGGTTSVAGGGTITVTNNDVTFSGIQQSTETTVIYSDGSFVDGGSRVESVVIGDGNSTIEGGSGNDFIQGTHRSETIIGGNGSDIISGDGQDDIIWGDLNYTETPTPDDDESNQGNSLFGTNDLIDGLGGDAGFGEGMVYVNDDGSTSAIDITSVFGEAGLDFFGTNYTSFYLNNNGNITFANSLWTYTPGVIDGGVNNPIIAPFWADVDTRGAAPNTPTPGGNSTGSNRVWYDLDTDNGIFTATWDDVGYYSSATDKLNAFQVQLVDQGEGTFDIIYRYENIDWTTGDASNGSGGLGGVVARAGYSAGNNFDYYELPESGNQDEILNLDQTGPYLFQVRHGVALATNNDDVINGGAGDDTLIGGKGDDTIEGGSGTDTAVYSGNYEDYVITENENTWTVSDTISDRDGVDTVHDDVEVLQFADRTFDLSPSVADRLAVDIFCAEAGEGISSLEAQNTGMMRVMADFSLAAYSLQSWENTFINDESTNGAAAHSALVNAQGWTPISLSPTLESESTVAGQTVTNKMADGYYTNGNAAAFVARCADSAVIAFRGTNDNGANTNDPGNTITPDVDHWQRMNEHYDLLEPLITEFDNYVSNNSISHVYVTGHSMGAAMAIEYLSQHAGSQYQGVSFAAPVFGGTGQTGDGWSDPWLTDLGTRQYADDDRLIQMEVTYDPVPMTHDINFFGMGSTGRPGQVVRFSGDNTMDTPDHYDNGWASDIIGNENNHSMDYYRLITRCVDSEGWQQILTASDDAREIIISGRTSGSNFIVDGRISGTNAVTDDGNDTLTDLSDRDFDVFFGGRGADLLTGGSAAEIILGGDGDDTIVAKGGNDILDGGDGSDIFKYETTGDGSDSILDFVAGTDKVYVVGSEFGELSTGTLSASNFIANTNPEPSDGNPVFLYNTNSGELAFDNNGTGWWGKSVIVNLTGIPGLTAGDIVVV